MQYRLLKEVEQDLHLKTEQVAHWIATGQIKTVVIDGRSAVDPETYEKILRMISEDVFKSVRFPISERTEGE